MKRERPATGTMKFGGIGKRLSSGRLWLTMSAPLLWAGTAAALVTPQASLNTCQNAVKAAAAQFVQGKIAAVSTCLQAISGNIINKNVPVSTITAKACVSQFRKIHDTRGKGFSLEEKKAKAINKKCEPGQPGVQHNINDITGNAGGLVAAPGLDTNNIEAWCERFTGSATIATVSDWITCIDDSHECAGDTAISTQYPRALEWLGLVRPVMAGLTPPATDPTKISDALTALDTVKAAIDGTPVDNKPDIECGAPVPPVCSTACCYQEFGLGAQVSCFQYTGTGAEVAAFTANCNGKSSTPPGAWTMSAGAGPCGNPPDFPAHVACPPPNTVVIPQDATCP
jgi:hypothetical protein